MRIIMFLAAAVLAANANAAAVFKCVDAAGKITFTQQNCPDLHRFDGAVNATNAAPSGSSAASLMNHDVQPESLGGARVSGTGPLPGSVPAPQAEPRQENTPQRNPVRKQRFADNCIRWVEKRVGGARKTANGMVGRSQIIKVPVPCG